MHLLNRKSVQVSIIIGLGILIYANSLQVPFYFDDYIQIINIPLVKSFSYFTDPNSAKAFRGYGGFISRYFGYLTFAVNYRLHGLNVVGYHLVNLAIHLLASVQVYRLVCLTYVTPYFRQRSDRASLEIRAGFVAFLAGLLFVAHPLQTQAVTYLVQRFASLAAMLYLLSLTSYIRARLIQQERGSRSPAAGAWFLAALVSAILAVKSKETSFTLPLAVMMYEFLFFTRNLKKKAALLGLASVAGVGALLWYRLPGGSLGAVLSRLDAATRVSSDASRLDYLATQCRVLVSYLRLLLFPVGQRLDYDYPLSRSFFEPAVLLSAALLVALFAGAVYALYRSGKAGVPGQEATAQLRVIAFGIFWFFITLSIESSIIPIADVIFEHRMYLPSAGLFLAAAAALSCLRGSGSPIPGWPGKPALAAAAGVILVLAGLTVARNQLWRDEVAFWQDNAEKAPRKARVVINLGRARERQGDLAGAAEAYRTAGALWPDQTDSMLNLGLIYSQMGRLPDALAQFKAALVIDPQLAEAHNNIGKILGTQGQLDEALKEFLQAAQLKPTLAEPQHNIGFVHALQKRYPEALTAYDKCLALDPDYQLGYAHRGAAYLATGRTSAAIDDLRRALEINPSDAESAMQLQRASQQR
jgi:protein O-mannosyl-transferase